MTEDLSDSGKYFDVLVVGAGPTGLTAAAQLARFGVRLRIIDKQLDRARESRALAVQARSLEVLQTLELGEELASRGSSTTRVMLHVDQHEPPIIDLGNVGRTDTRFPFILFVSQAETESVLAEHLTKCGVTVERGTELVGFEQRSEGIVCVLKHCGDREESVTVKYLVGCDGAHSIVRKQAGISFMGGSYAQEFALGDVEADGLQTGAIHAFAGGRGFAMFFPLGHPTTWRVMGMDAGGSIQHPANENQEITVQPLSLAELQSMIDEPTYRSVTVREAAWLTRFRLHHRQAETYRIGRVFLAGDAAHIHSPVGAQGMNTGIQDAWNLGWKLALAVRGFADERLLDSYHAERWPVGRTLLRVTDRLFGGFAKSMFAGSFVRSFRRVLVRGVVAPALSRPTIRRFGFHFVSQLAIQYRNSPVVAEGEPRLRRGPKAGDRLPDARVQRKGEDVYLQQELGSAHLQLLLCGPVDEWHRPQVIELGDRFPGLIVITHLSRDNVDRALLDPEGEAFAELGIEDTAQYLIRPDGHIAFRCGGTDLSSVRAYLERWFKPGHR
jgi:2-polyprenyl-6-methoxyphenol hydroxylase-like FAD-dependent oxidoreductase